MPDAIVMNKKNLATFRMEYTMTALDESKAPSNPIVLFSRWLDEAILQELPEPNAMTLATVTPDGKPSARVVLLKELDNGHFVFYTNYMSRKGRELRANPNAALVFLWLELQRQVRVSGQVEKVSAAVSDAYFAARPKNSQIGALASPQSQPVKNREEIEMQYFALHERFKSQKIGRPAHWGGYRLQPESIEFWQGRENRMHDRLLYEKQNDQWRIQRLAP